MELAERRRQELQEATREYTRAKASASPVMAPTAHSSWTGVPAEPVAALSRASPELSPKWSPLSQVGREPRRSFGMVTTMRPTGSTPCLSPGGSQRHTISSALSSCRRSYGWCDPSQPGSYVSSAPPPTSLPQCFSGGSSTVSSYSLDVHEACFVGRSNAHISPMKVQRSPLRTEQIPPSPTSAAWHQGASPSPVIRVVRATSPSSVIRMTSPGPSSGTPVIRTVASRPLQHSNSPMTPGPPVVLTTEPRACSPVAQRKPISSASVDDGKDYPPSRMDETSILSSTQVGGVAPIRSLVEVALAGHTACRGRVYLYRAPFTPSIHYTGGDELFSIPAGWMVIHSRGGLIVWVELLDDLVLRDAFSQLPDTPSSTSGSIASVQETVNGLISLAPLSDVLGSLFLCLPAPTGGIQSRVELSVLSASSPLSAPIKVPCDDIGVMHPIGAGVTLHVQLGNPAETTESFDQVFKTWLSAWEVLL